MPDKPHRPFWSRVLRDMADALTVCAKITGGLMGFWLVLWADTAIQGDDGLMRWLTSTDLTFGQVLVAFGLYHLLARRD